MSNPEGRIKAAARGYVDAQIETMRRWDSDPRLTPARYEQLVEEVAAITSRLWRNYYVSAGRNSPGS